MKKTFIEFLERDELVKKLISRGYGKLVDALLLEESYTKKDRLNKSSVCRALDWKPKQLEDALNECRELLRDDLGDELGG